MRLVVVFGNCDYGVLGGSKEVKVARWVAKRLVLKEEEEKGMREREEEVLGVGKEGIELKGWMEELGKWWSFEREEE